MKELLSQAKILFYFSPEQVVGQLTYPQQKI